MSDGAFVNEFRSSEQDVADHHVMHRRDQGQVGDERGRLAQCVDQPRDLDMVAECCGNNPSDGVAVVGDLCTNVERGG